MASSKPIWHALSNYYDGLSNRLITKAVVAEAFDPKKIDPNTIKHIETDALWDTGATHSVITPKVVKDLGLKPVGKIQVSHGGGQTEEDTYIVNVILPNGVAISGVMMSEMKQVVDNFGIIIGMDVISLGDFSVTNFRGKTCFSFRLPSQGTVDFVKEHRASAGARPNDICPFCDSGRKFKKCHGASA